MKKNCSQDMVLWRESLTAMSETRFFDLVRLYLGEVKTPYSKQKLIESLVSFFNKDENRKILVKLLSYEDYMLIAAVMHIPRCTQEKATAFFSPHFSFAFLNNAFLNLEERLVLFRRKDIDSEKDYFDVHPLLRKEIEPFTRIDVLFSQTGDIGSGGGQCVCLNEGEERGFLSAQILASWLAFTSENPDYCRLDGSFKKKAQELIQSRFTETSLVFLQNVNKALLNLSLFRQKEAAFKADKRKWKSFAALLPLHQYAYITAAFCGSQRRDVLQKNATLVLELLSLLPPQGFSRCHVLRLIFLLKERQNELPSKQGRLRVLLQENLGYADCSQTFTPEHLFEALVSFGLLKSFTGEKKTEKLFTVNPRLRMQKADFLENSVSINAGFSITVLKELSLSVFIDLISCMDLETCAVVSRFRITRSSCFRAFADGTKPQDIIDLLKKTTSHNIPQTLIFSLQDWYTLYSSGNLFKGYMLQVALEKQVQVEKNPFLAPRIRETFAPGLYLLDFSDDNEAFETIRKSGLDFIGKIKNQNTETEILPFESLDKKFCTPSVGSPFRSFSPDGSDCINSALSADLFAENENFQKQHIQRMKKELEKKNLSKEQKEEFLLRIERKTILNVGQLKENSVRAEKNEAFGMDFLGKIHLVEQALACSDFLEVSSGGQVLTGLPLRMEKQAGDAVLVIQTGDTEEIKKISVAQARLIKRIRSSVFSSSK